MSRIGKKPVQVPPGVKVQVVDHTITVEGPLGKLDLDCGWHNHPMNRGKVRARRCCGFYAYPHPSPLPRGEGDVVAASRQYGCVGLAAVQGFNARGHSAISHSSLLPLLSGAGTVAATVPSFLDPPGCWTAGIGWKFKEGAEMRTLLLGGQRQGGPTSVIGDGSRKLLSGVMLSWLQ